MDVNLNDWLGDHVWAWWSCLVVLCVAAAVVARRRIVLAVAAGPLVAAFLGGVRQDWFWAQVVATVVVSVVAVAVVRWARRDGPPARPAR